MVANSSEAKSMESSFVRLRIRLHKANAVAQDLIKYGDGAQHRLLSLAHAGLAIEQYLMAQGSGKTTAIPLPLHQIAPTVASSKASAETSQAATPSVATPVLVPSAPPDINPLADMGLDVASVTTYRG